MNGINILKADSQAARRSMVAFAAQKILLLLTFLAAYLNPILRPSVESDMTVFRAILPLVATLIFLRYLRHDLTHRFIIYLGIVFAYSLGQMYLFGLLSDRFVWSYLINILGLIAFIYFVVLYKYIYGEEDLYRHLYFWYLVTILASLHQLLTGFVYPNVLYLNDQNVARIFHGQENDASLAIAGFLPVLMARCRKDPIALVLLIAGICIININSTRGILLAVGAYPLLCVMAWVIGKLGRRIKILLPLVAAIVLCVGIGSFYLLKDVSISVGGDESTLNDLVLAPLTEIAQQQTMEEQLTSINLRVTAVVLGTQKYLASWGFGISPGASSYFVIDWYEGIAGSMHVFPFQLLTECGWLFVGTMIWLVMKFGPRLGWQRFVPLMLYFILAALSITSGAITNYYFFACAAFSLIAPSYLETKQPARDKTATMHWREVSETSQ